MPHSIESNIQPNAVIGCSSSHSGCDHSFHPSDSYLSINSDSFVRPDILLDIRAQLPNELHQRFNITFSENLDFVAYNDSVFSSKSNKDGIKGFQNMWNMTKDSGFIVISGCPRFKEYRNSIKALNYIEISREFNDHECVIIPKNQDLTIEEVNQQIQDSPDLLALIRKHNLTRYVPKDKFYSFSSIQFDSLPTLRNWKGYEAPEQPFLKQHKKDVQVAALYQSIIALKAWAEQNPRFERYGRNVRLDNARQLERYADSFFEYDTNIVNRDLPIFKNQFLSLLHRQKEPLIQKNSDYALILLNIALALTGIGAIAVGAKMIYSRSCSGRFLPLFFSHQKDSCLLNLEVEAQALARSGLRAV